MESPSTCISLINCFCLFLNLSSMPGGGAGGKGCGFISGTTGFSFAGAGGVVMATGFSVERGGVTAITGSGTGAGAGAGAAIALWLNPRMLSISSGSLAPVV